MFKKKDEVVGGSKFDVEDTSKYEYLEPIWPVLRNTPEEGITGEELFKETNLEMNKAHELIKDLMFTWQNILTKELKNPFNLMKMARDSFFEKNLANSWLFDKLMLLGTRIDTGNPNPMKNPITDRWTKKWLETQGM